MNKLASTYVATPDFSTTLTPAISNSTYALPYTEEWVIASTCILAIFFVFGVFANSVTIAVIRKSPKLQSHYYTFIASICVSDITSSFVSILFLYRRTWGFLHFAWPEIFCRLYWGLDLWSSFATALHILSFAILRLIGVKWPIVFQSINKKVMTIWIGSIWTVTFLGGFIPHFIFNTANDIDRQNEPDRARWASCSLSPYWFNTWQVYVQFAYTIFLYLPAAGIIAISISIAVILKRKRRPLTCKNTSTLSSANGAESNTNTSNNKPATQTDMKKKREEAADRRWRKNKQAIYQLFLIVLSFFFGYIPLTAFHFYTGFTINLSNNHINQIDWRFAMIQYMMLRFSECLNPIFYNVASKKMREESIKMLKRAFYPMFNFLTTSVSNRLSYGAKQSYTVSDV